MRTVAYKELLSKLPEEVQQLAEKAFQLFEANPRHPALRWHELETNHRGSHREGSYSVSVTMMYRAIYFHDWSCR